MLFNQSTEVWTRSCLRTERLFLRIVKIGQNPDRALEAWPRGVTSAAANDVEFHMHCRASPPPVQNNPVQHRRPLQVVLPASDERSEGAATGLDLIDRLKPDDGRDAGVGGWCCIQNLSGKNASDSTSRDALQKRKRSDPFREGDFNAPMIFVLPFCISGHGQTWVVRSSCHCSLRTGTAACECR